MKQIISKKHHEFLKTLFKSAIFFVPVLMICLALGIIGSPLWFSYLIIGQYFGVYLGNIVLAVILVIPMFPAIFSLLKRNKKTTFKKMMNKRNLITIGLSTLIAFLVVSLFDFAVLGLVSTAKRDEFVNQNQYEDLESLVNKVDSFLKSNLKNCYKKAESQFKIDNYIYPCIFDYEIMKFHGLTRADIVLFQKWETCGQTAVVTSQLLSDLGFETRRAWFIDVDHEWVEVKYNGEWVSFDSYVGYLREIGDLNTRFTEPTGVEFVFRNGTRIDMSAEHGYMNDE